MRDRVDDHSLDNCTQVPGEARFWLAALTDASDNAVVGTDIGGIVTSWNKTAELMLGFTLAEIAGQPINCIIPPDKIADEADILARINRGEQVAPYETKWRRRDDSIVSVLINVSSVRDDAGELIGVSTIAHDLTRRDAREQELRAANADLERLARHLGKERDRANRANRAKSHFLAGMSHELRTPLNGILGYAELLHMDGGLSATQSARVEAMLSAGRHLLQMLTCVLDLSEIEAEHTTVQLVECDVEAIASACLDLVRPPASAKNLNLSIAVTPGTQLRLVTDPMRLRQVLFNLLGNAVKFTRRGAIELRLRSVADCSALRIEVTDTGPGISADKRQRLFQDFERLEDGTTDVIEGAGLGLALSARLAALMGGRIGHDDNPNGGSVFWLELPLSSAAKSSRPAAAPAEVPDTVAATDRVLHVLVVDDILMNCDIAGSFLSAAGHKVSFVEDGQEAVEAVKGTDFDVVLMDLRMPRMDGFQATQQIRALEGQRGRVPIVAMTAQAFAEQVEECRKAGMDGHLPKPFNQAGLLAAVGRAAAAARALAEDADASSTPRTKVVPVIGADLQVVDLQAFDHTTGHLAPEAVAAYLKTLVTDGERLLHDLRDTQALINDADKIAQAVHTLAGSAGMFGFERLAALGRRVDHAIRAGATDAGDLADALSTTIEATVVAIRDCTARMGRARSAADDRIQRPRILIVEDDAIQAEVLKSVLLAANFAVDSVSSGLEAVRQMRPGLYRCSPCRLRDSRN